MCEGTDRDVEYSGSFNGSTDSLTDKDILDEIDEMEELGIALNIPNILDLNPARLQSILDLRYKEKIEKFNSDMGFAWEIGRLVGLAVNSPKQYPKRPTSYKERVPEVQTKEEYLKEWRSFVEQNKKT